jgi:uncharacterized delta-60 repeat protein
MKTKLYLQNKSTIVISFLNFQLSKLFLGLVIFINCSAVAQGGLDLSFVSGTVASTGNVSSSVVQSDGKLVIGGTFTSYNGTSINRIGRVNTDGSLDATFNVGTGANQLISKVLLQSDGKIIIVGNFTTYNGTAKNRIVRLNSDGSIDGTFNIGTGANSQIYSAALQSDGKIVIGGTFTSYNGTTGVNRLARLNSDGTLDGSFSAGTGPDSWTYAMAIQPDGKIIIVGNFSSYSGTTVNRVARVTSTGALDNLLSFNAGSAISVAGSIGYAVDLQSDGKIIIGGNFTTFNGSTKNRLVRLNTDGSTDNTFNSGGSDANNVVYSCKVQPDDKILIGGHFTTFNGVTIPARVACLNSDGTRDATFNAGGAGATSSFVLDIALNSSQEIFIGGAFIAYNGTTRNKLAKLLKSCINASVTSVSATSYSNCGTQSTTLTVSGSLNDATNWQWYNAGCGTGSVGTGTSIIVSPSITTSYYVRGEGGCANPLSCSTLTINVNSNPTITISSSSSSVCVGSLLLLNGSGATSYTWNPGNQTGATIAVGPSVTATYSVTGTDINGCSNNTVTTITSVNCVTQTKLTNAICNSTLSTMDATTRLYCDAVSGSTNYEWQFTDVSTGNVVLTKLRAAQWTDFYLTGYFPTIQYNKTYSIKVRAYVGGIWGLYGTACNLTTPFAPVLPTQLTTAYCNTTLATLGSSTKIYCDAVTGATNYEWQITDPSTGNVVFTKQRGAQWTDFYLKGYFKTIQLNKTYSIKVRANVGGVWGAYGPACNLTTPSSFSRLANNLIDELNTQSSFIITAYPNPVSEVLKIELDLIPKNAFIEIYNSIGELVLSNDLTDFTNSINTSHLTSGLYHLKIIGEGQLLQTSRIIKQ